MNTRAMLTENSDCFGKCFNVAYGSRMSINELYFGIRDSLAQFDPEIKEIDPTYTEERAGDIKHSIADISMAKDLLGYNPEYDCHQGLREAIEWYWNALS